MFRSLRWRLTFWFVLLTTAVYALSAMYSLYVFREGLTNLIEDELEALMSEIEPAIQWIFYMGGFGMWQWCAPP